MKKIYLNEMEPEEFGEIVNVAVERAFKAMTDKVNDERYLSINEARKLFAPPLSRPTIQKLRDSGALKTYFLPSVNKPMFRYNDVLSVAKEHRTLKSRLKQ